MSVKITISNKTKNHLIKYGCMDSTFDSVICELLDHVETCDKY